MFDNIKKLMELKETVTATKKRLDEMVIKETSPKGYFELTISGSQKVSEVKVLKDIDLSKEDLAEEIKGLMNKAITSSQNSAMQAMGGLGALGNFFK